MDSMIIRSSYPEVTVPEVSLPALVFADAASRADKPALIDGPSGRAITYGELVGGARLVAGGLAARGFQAGEVFAIYCPNLPEYAVAFYGVLLAGGPTPPSTPCTPSRSSPPSSTTPAPATCSPSRRSWTRPSRRPAARGAGGVRARRGSGCHPFRGPAALGHQPHPRCPSTPTATWPPALFQRHRPACPRGSCSPTATWSPTSASSSRWWTWARRRPASPCCRSSTSMGRWC